MQDPKPDATPKPREWHPRQIFVPVESPTGHLRTSDGEVYQRDKSSGVIRAVQPKRRGKAARRAEKKIRHWLRAHPPRPSSVITDDPEILAVRKTPAQSDGLP